MKCIFVLLSILFFVGFVFAGITPAIVAIPTMFGGDSFSQTLTVTNEFNSKIFVELVQVVDNNSKDFNGFYSSFSDNNFYLDALASKDVDFNISFDLNILPEVYDINIYAIYTVSVPQNPNEGVKYFVSSGSSSRKTIVIDNNIDSNEVIYLPGETNEIVTTIYIDKNQIIYLPYDTNVVTGGESTRSVVDSAVIALIGLVVGGVLVFIFMQVFIRKE